MDLDILIETSNEKISGVITRSGNNFYFFPVIGETIYDGLNINDKSKQLEALKSHQFIYVDITFHKKPYDTKNIFKNYQYSIDIKETFSIQSEENPNATVVQAMKDGEFKNIVKQALEA